MELESEAQYQPVKYPKSTDVKFYVHKIPYSIDPLLIEDNQCNFKGSPLQFWSTGISLDGDGCELSKSTDVKLYVHKIPYSIDPLLIEDNQCNFKMQSTTVLKDDDCSWNI